MSVFKNTGLYSSSSDVSTGPGCESLSNFENNSYNTRLEKNYWANTKPESPSNRRECQVVMAKAGSNQESKTYFFWTLVALLFILAFGNMVLTFVILTVLRLGQGMESLELVPAESLIKFFGNTDLDNIYKRDGKLESFKDSPLEIVGDDANVHIGISETEREFTPLVNLAHKFHMVRNVESFKVKHPITGKSFFSTDFPNFGLPRGVDKLDVQVVLTKRISSAVDESLLIKSDSFVKMKGSEGVHIRGKEIILSADQDIFLKSVNKTIMFSGPDGVFIDTRNMPITTKQSNDMRSQTQYKICVCMPEGKLFRLSVPPGTTAPISCHDIDHSSIHNPCM